MAFKSQSWLPPTHSSTTNVSVEVVNFVDVTDFVVASVLVNVVSVEVDVEMSMTAVVSLPKCIGFGDGPY